MCGIIGYVGESNAVPYLIKGLKKLEYRGYDSSGIALHKANEIFLLKRKGKISELEKSISPELFSFCGIGHTRWATHGEPSARNAHPHLSPDGSFAVVHNGIIENSSSLKESLITQGCRFISDTDTEVICHLLEKNYSGDPLTCIADTVRLLEGSYALAVIHKDFPKTIFCAKKDSPLLVSTGPLGNFVFSDSSAAEEYSEGCYSLCDNEFAVITDKTVSFFDSEALPVSKRPSAVVCKNCCEGKMGFAHYMLKEIFEEPSAVAHTVKAYCKDGRIHFPLADMSSQDIKNIRSIHIVGCGSAYHAGIYGRYVIEELTGMAVFTHIASEFRYGSVPLDEKSLVIIISQSGETADSIAALKKANDCGAKTLAIVNVEDSTMTKYARMLIYTRAGKEIAVATTKAYLCQIAVMYLLGLYLAEKSAFLTDSELHSHIDSICRLDSVIENQLKDSGKLQDIAADLIKAEHIYFIGRNTDYALALEGALKMKEISYIHCEAYPAGELKHGTISLIEKGTPVVAICLREDIFAKTLSNIQELKARGARIICIAKQEFARFFDSDDTLIITHTLPRDMMTALSGIIPLQLLSYYVSDLKGCEVDKPRNLAKSVTVE